MLDYGIRIALIICFHSSIDQIVSLVLVTGIISLLLMGVFYLYIRHRKGDMHEQYTEYHPA